ncbi:MAG: AI-2E family transporter [Lachnospiraceae bacterium]|nr:AI-2E family transporter [Lachnospiraceae bacterium]
MEFSKAKIRQIRNLMILAAVLVLLVVYSKYTIAGFQLLTKVFTPVIAGGVVAFILNLPMRAYERWLFGKAKKKFALAIKRPVCFILAFITVVLIVTGVLLAVIPQLTATIGMLGKKIPVFIEDIIAFLEKLAKDYPQVNDLIESLESSQVNWDTVLDKVGSFLKDGVGNVLNSTFSVASGLVSGVANGVIALIFSIYILFQKEKLASQGTRIITAYLPEKSANNVLRVLSILQRNFSNFITGQCIEALVIGTLITVTMSIFRMPYAVMIGVLTAFTALIPIVGAFVGCVVGAFLILIENPMTALWFVVMFLIIQQIEGNLIYPKVVGNSVGLPSLWVLFAVTVGGSLFGIMGILCFIPILSTAYLLLRENVDARNAVKQAKTVVVEVPEEAEKEE